MDRAPVEQFRYKVVYPGGTYIRVSPHVESERTGEIIEYGSVFSASKSLVLDGINFVKLADNRGWVFGNKGDTEVLELIEVVRVPGSALLAVEGSAPANGSEPPAGLSAAAAGAQSAASVAAAASIVPQTLVLRAAKEREKLFQGARADGRFWKDAGAKALECESFDAFLQLSTELAADREHGFAAAASAAVSARPQSHQVRNLICIIVSITRQCAPDVADLHGLEPALWVLVHLGPRSCSHAVQLAVSAANARFEWLDEERQAELLYVLLEAAARTRQLGSDLSRLVPASADDVKNFLQRWLIVRSYEIEYVFVEDPPFPGGLGGGGAGGGEGGAGGGWSADGTDQPGLVARTPTGGRGKASGWLEMPAWLCGVTGMGGGGAGGGFGAGSRGRGRGRGRGGFRARAGVPVTAAALSALDGGGGGGEGVGPGGAGGEGEDGDGGLPIGVREGEGEPFWRGLRRRVREIISDPDLQLAGII